MENFKEKLINVLVILALNFLCFIMLYLMISVVESNFNVSNWKQEVKNSLLVIQGLLLVVSFSVVLIHTISD